MLKEQVAEMLFDFCYPHGKGHFETRQASVRRQWLDKAEQILNLFKAEVDKLTVMDYAEVARVLHKTPLTKLKLESQLTDRDREAFRDEMKIELKAIKEAQLQHTKKHLLEGLEG